MSAHPAIRLSPDVVFRDLEGEAVLLDLSTGTYFGLNEVATRVWTLLGTGAPIATIVDVIADEYEAEPEAIAKDIEALLGELRSRRLVVEEGA